MPLPSPRKGEERGAFVSRCVSELSDKKEGKDAKQRVAICNSQFSRAKSEASSVIPHILEYLRKTR